MELIQQPVISWFLDKDKWEKMKYCIYLCGSIAAEKWNNLFLKVPHLCMWSFHPSWSIKMFLCHTPNMFVMSDIFCRNALNTQMQKKKQTKTSTGKHLTSFVLFSFLVCPTGLLEMWNNKNMFKVAWTVIMAEKTFPGYFWIPGAMWIYQM